MRILPWNETDWTDSQQWIDLQTYIENLGGSRWFTWKGYGDDRWVAIDDAGQFIGFGTVNEDAFSPDEQFEGHGIMIYTRSPEVLDAMAAHLLSRSAGKTLVYHRLNHRDLSRDLGHGNPLYVCPASIPGYLQFLKANLADSLDRARKNPA